VATLACGRQCTTQTRLQRPNQVFDEKPKRKTATRGDLAGGESHDAWATGQDSNHKDPPRLLGSKGCKSVVTTIACGHRQRGRGDVGAAALMVTLLVRRCVSACATVRARQCAPARWLPQLA
jgi:hypothetical protein